MTDNKDAENESKGGDRHNAGQAGTRTPQASGALSRYLVLDLTRVRSGPVSYTHLTLPTILLV